MNFAQDCLKGSVNLQIKKNQIFRNYKRIASSRVNEMILISVVNDYDYDSTNSRLVDLLQIVD